MSRCERIASLSLLEFFFIRDTDVQIAFPSNLGEQLASDGNRNNLAIKVENIEQYW